MDTRTIAPSNHKEIPKESLGLWLGMLLPWILAVLDRQPRRRSSSSRQVLSDPEPAPVELRVGSPHLMEWDFAILLFLILAIPVLSGVVQHFTKDRKLDDDEDDWWRRIK
jgi:hypothetical protein